MSGEGPSRVPSFTVTVYPFGQPLTNTVHSEEDLFNFLRSWFTLSPKGDVEIAFKDTF